MAGKTLIAICTTEIPAGVPDWVHLMPLGNIVGRDGRRWKLPDPAAVVAASRAIGQDLVIDYEHQTDNAPNNGRPAPAAGWIKELAVRADGIWGRVEWTEAAASHLQAREYRYLSPTFAFDRNTGEVKVLMRAALTNVPDLHLTALARQSDEESRMEELLKKLLAALGLADGCDEKTALARVDDLVKGADAAKAAETVLATTRTALGLAADADGKTIETAIAAAREKKTDVDPNAFVPRSDFERVATALASIQKGMATDKATAAVDQALAEGKFNPAGREHYIRQATANLDEFLALCKVTPATLKPGATLSTDKPKAGDPLSDDEKAVCRQLGITEDAFKKSRDEEVAR